MSNIIPLNPNNAESANQVHEQSAQDNLEEQPAEFKNVIWLKINNLDVIGYTDKDISYNVIVFATIDLKSPASIVQSESGTTMVPYFKFAAEAVATFNTTCIEAFIPLDKLPVDIVSQYVYYANGISGEKDES